MNLKEFREALLQMERPEEVLLLADNYLQVMDKLGDAFILPREHVMARTALEYFAGNLEGWVKFLKSVRDKLPRAGRQYHPGVNDLYRKAELRLIQQQRRERLNAAVEMAVRRQLIPNTAYDKKRYADRCTKTWMQGVNNLIKTARLTHAKVSTEERAMLRDSFWEQVGIDIANGDLPKP